jgi:hypothetical protein
MVLKENLAALEAHISELKDRRTVGPLQNDIYEAVDDCCHLGRCAIENDTRVNFPARAQSEIAHLEEISKSWRNKNPQGLQQYDALLHSARELIEQVAQIQTVKNGHLGILETIRKRFAWLSEEFGFVIEDEQPTGACLTSGQVFVELAWATQSSQSFAIARDKANYFWLEDLLFLYGDSRYKNVPVSLDMKTEEDVEIWFDFASNILREYGHNLLTNQPEAWSRLTEAQLKRDAEYAAMMNAKHG